MNGWLPRTSPARIARGFALVVLLSAPGAALASGGGGAATSVCPWAKELHLSIAGHALVVPQAVFDSKVKPVSIDGYDLLPDIDKLKLIIIDPYSDIWEVALTLLAGGKRCRAFYGGTPIMISDTGGGQTGPHPSAH